MGWPSLPLIFPISRTLIIINSVQWNNNNGSGRAILYCTIHQHKTFQHSASLSLFIFILIKPQNNDNYRLITAYSLLRVNLDKIMHARWDFDASSARTRRVSALDKHQNWSASALFCLNSRAQSKYAVVNLIHTQRKQTFCLLLCDK